MHYSWDRICKLHNNRELNAERSGRRPKEPPPHLASGHADFPTKPSLSENENPVDTAGGIAESLCAEWAATANLPGRVVLAGTAGLVTWGGMSSDLLA